MASTPSYRLSHCHHVVSWSRLCAILLLFGLSRAGAAETWLSDHAVQQASIALSPTAFIGGLAVDPEGRAIIYNGEAVVRQTVDGWEELYRPFDPDAPDTVFYGAFVKYHNGLIYFGESTYGTIRSIHPDTHEAVLVETLSFNFDMVFDAAGRAFISAPAPGSTWENPVNAIYLADLDPETSPAAAALINGYSGPLLVDAEGSLCIATSIFMAPSDIIRFSMADLENALPSDPLTLEDGHILAAGLDNIYSMTLGPFGLILASDSINGSIQAVTPQGKVVPWAMPEDGSASSTYMDYHADTDVLMFADTDYATFNEITRLASDAPFIRGNVNQDDSVDLSDAISILDFIFNQGNAAPNLDSMDVNDDARVDLADAIYLLTHLFRDGPDPEAPFQEPGIDETPDAL